MKSVFASFLRFAFAMTILTFIVVSIWTAITFQRDEDGIPQIHLHNLRAIQYHKKATAYLSYVSNEVGVEHIYLQEIEAKSRGGATADYPKHNYTIELGKAHKLGGLKMEDDWILNASYLDKSFIRHKLSFDLFRSFRKKNISAHCAFVELYRHFNYHGLYLLMERLDAKRLKIDKSDSQARIFKDPPVFEHPSIIVNSNPYEENDVYHQKYPAKDSVNYNGEMEAIRSFLANSSDSLFDAQIERIFDLKNIIDWHLLLLVTHNGDGLVKNFYLYKKDAQTPYRIAPWDYDHSFGRDGDNEKHLPGVIDCSRNMLLRRLQLSKTIEYNQALKNRFYELKGEGILTAENLLHEVSTHEESMRKHIQKNNLKWPLDAPAFKDANTFEEELNYIRQWIPKQMEELAHYFQSIESKH